MANVTLTATFTAAGAFSWTCPAGVTSVVVACTGAGGGGGGCSSTSGSNGGGGGGGEAALEPALAVTPGLSYSGTVGAGGTTATNGGDSFFTGDGGVQVYAHGGAGAHDAGASGNGPHGAGGNGSANSVSAIGGSGDDGTAATNGGGGGGAAGVSLGAGAPGNPGSGSTAGAASGGTFPGAAGGTGATTGAAGGAGSAPGGGGGGALSTGTGHAGGTGGNGQVVITWTQADPVTLAANTAGGSYTYTAPLGASQVTAQAWGAGASGYSTPPSNGGSPVQGRAGATVWQVYGITDKTQRVAAANIFDGYVGVPMALQAQKVYYNETGADSIAQYNTVNDPQPVGILAAAGAQIILCPKANRDYGTTDDFTALQSAVADIKSHIGAANLMVVLWQEATDQWFPSAAAYLAYWNHYVGAIPSDVQVAVDVGAGPGLAADQAYAQAVLGSSVRPPDIVGVDVYDSSYHFGRNYLTYPPSDPNYPGIFDIADTAGATPAILEWGQSASASYTETAANWNDYIYGPHGLLTIVKARIAAGKKMGHFLYYGGSGPGNNDIESSSDFRIQAIMDVYNAMTSAVGGAAGGSGGGGGEFAQESSLAVTGGSSYALTVGAGGTGSSSGGSSTIAGDSVTVTAHGGSVATATTAGGSGGSGSSNTTHHSGGHGGAGGGASGGGGGGGSSGGTAAAGNAGAAGTATAGGTGGTAPTGGGKGGGGHNPSVSGGAGSGPGGGGGGGGASSLNTGAGADGQITLSGFVTNPAGMASVALAPLAVSGAVFVGSVSGQPALAPMAVSGTVTVSGGSPTVTTTGSVSLAPLAVAAGGSAGVPAGMVATSGAVALAPMAVQSPSLATDFPFHELPITVEILINDVWCDITESVRATAGINISQRGRPDEASTAQSMQCSFTLDNSDASFSPYNTAGPYYPYLTRNTQIRFAVQGAVSRYGAQYTGYRFWGEVPSWPPVFDVTGHSLFVTVTAAGVLQRMQQNKNFGSPLARYYASQVAALAAAQPGTVSTDGVLGQGLVPAGYWTCEDASGSSSFASGIVGGSPMTWTGGTPGLAGDSNIPGSNPVATTNSTAWTGTVGAFPTGGVTFDTPGTFSWTCPQGVTSITAECWGAGGGGSSGDNQAGSGGGGGEYAAETTLAVTPGTTYTLVVGAGGSGGAGTFKNTPLVGGNGGSSTFKGDTITVRAHGGKGATGSSSGAGGTGSTNSTHHNGGHGGSSGSGFGGCGGGGSGGNGSAGNNGHANSATAGGTGASAVTDGGPGGNGGNGALASQGSAATPGFMPFPGPGGGGGGGGYNGGDNYGKPGGGGQNGQVRISYGPTGTANANVLRFVVDVPSGGGVDGATLAQILTSGTVASLTVTYHTGSGGQLALTGKNSGGTTIISSGTKVFGCDGQPMMISAELRQTGGFFPAVKWKLTAITPNATQAVATYTGTVSGSGFVGDVSQVNVNNGGATDTGSGIGHVSVQYQVDPILNLAPALAGYAGELASVRFARLCGQQQIPFELVGSDADTAAMGVQTDQPLLSLLQECETADLGLMFEPRTQFGLAYRTRVSMQNQAPGAILDYSLGTLVPPLQPVDDDQLTRNDITITRTNGSSYEAVLLTGPMSTADPPDGVSSYAYTSTVNLYADTQLQEYATWLLTLGTVDEFRYPVIKVDLTAGEVADGNFYAVPALDIGDFLQVIWPTGGIEDVYPPTYQATYGVTTVDDPPPYLTFPISELCFGFTETLSSFAWTIAVNAVPESPYASGGGDTLPSW